MRSRTICTLGLLALATVATAVAEKHGEVDGPSDPDLSSPFSIGDSIFGFPGISVPGIQSFTYVITNVSNQTSGDITAQLVIARATQDQSGQVILGTALAITGCTFTVPAHTNNASVNQTCNVLPSDNTKLIYLGIINTFTTSQNLGFGLNAAAGGLTFSSTGQLTWNINPTPPYTLAFFSSGAGLAQQTYPISGFGSGLTCALNGASTGSGPACAGNGTSWLNGTLSSTSAPATLTVSVTPGVLTPGVYDNSVTVSNSFGSATLNVTLTVLPTTKQYLQQGPKFSQTGTFQGSLLAVSQDGGTVLAGAPGVFGSFEVFNRFGGFWSFNQNLPTTFTFASATDQGVSVALSGDGSVMLVGGRPTGSNGVGGAWVYGGPCQSKELIGSNATGNSGQGLGVTLSGDGLTAVVGGPNDNSFLGAAWVFICFQGTWQQQGSKLTPNNNIGTSPSFGTTIALSQDGNTALIGGVGDNTSVGAAWVFTRSGTSWSQQAKLLGVTSGFTEQGAAVALSADGNTAVVGGLFYNNSAGAAWVFTRTGTTWSSGTILQGTGAQGSSVFQGSSVAISPDATTIAVGGNSDNSGVGAAWVFQKNGGGWSQFGSKLTGAGASGAANDGAAVALSQGGGTLLVGGPDDSTNAGAIWSYVMSGPAPTLSSLNPPQALAGSSALTLTVNGTNFLNGATVQWNGLPLATTFVSSSQVTAAVSANLLSSGDTVPVTVANPDGSPTSAGTFTVLAPALSITNTPTGNFTYGEMGATYTVTVSNTGNGTTNSPVTVTDTPISGMTLISMSGQGWSCPADNQCITTGALGPGQSYPAISVAVQIAPNASSPVVNQASVSGGGSAALSTSTSTPLVVTSACDVNVDLTFGSADVQQMIKEALGLQPAYNDQNGDGKVNVYDVQRVLNAALYRICL